MRNTMTSPQTRLNAAIVPILTNEAASPIGVKPATMAMINPLTKIIFIGFSYGDWWMQKNSVTCHPAQSPDKCVSNHNTLTSMTVVKPAIAPTATTPAAKGMI